MVTEPLAYSLHWPTAQPRVERRERSPFRVTMARAVADLQDALRLFGTETGQPVSNLVISSNVTVGRARPEDPGVAVYFEWDGTRRCIAVDRFPTPADNLRAIYYVLEARRQEMRFGGLHVVRASFRGFDALPAPNDWRSTLGLHGVADATPQTVDAAWRIRARAAHPDQPGGSAERMATLNAARDAARKELSE